MRPDADVLVVGAGPAGATAARALASGGARVLAVDRSRFPRNKPCGGAITVRALRRFSYLGPALRRISTHFVSRLYLEGPSGATLELRSESPAVLMIRRVEFDHLLVDLARQTGAEVAEGVAISQVTTGDGIVRATSRDGRTFTARALVAADGVNGVVTRRLGLNNGWPASKVAIDMMEETPDRRLRATDPGTLFVTYGYGGTDGYGYIFPKHDHTNVGIGCLLDCFRARVRTAPYELQARFVETLCARGALEGGSSRQTFTPAMIPVGGPLRRTARGRVLVAGDAGGFVNAYTAEGIYYAMVTGDLAARAILEGGSPARRYESMWRRELGAELADALLIQRFLFRRTSRIESVVRGANEHRDLAHLIVAYVSGDIEYAVARRRVLTRFPGVGLRFAIQRLAARLPGLGRSAR